MAKAKDAKEKTKKPEKKKEYKEGGIIYTETYFQNLHEKTVKRDQKLLPVRTFVTEPAYVGQERGLTLGIGGYDMVKTRTWCQVPCYREEVDAAMDYCEKKCLERTREVFQEVSGSKRSIPTKFTEDKDAEENTGIKEERKSC